LTNGIFFVLHNLFYDFTQVKRKPNPQSRDFVMPQIKSAKKRLKQNEAAQKRNSAKKSRMRTTRRKFHEAVEAGELEAATAAYAEFCSALDKAVKHKIIKRNTSIRSKQRGAEKLRGMGAAETA
jgi:small subunit ribosomal protein S20